MPTTQRTNALFSDRHEVGETLCFGRLPRAGLVDPVALAVSPGGVEVAFPYAWLQGGTLHLLPAEDTPVALLAAPGLVRDGRAGARGLRPGAPRLDGVAGRDVVLFDDGLAPVATLVDAANAIRRGGPRRFVLAVPIATPPVRRLFAPRLVESVIAARPAPRDGGGADLYADTDPSSFDRARAMIVDVLAGASRRVPDLVLTDGPALVSAAEEGVVVHDVGPEDGARRHGESRRAGNGARPPGDVARPPGDVARPPAEVARPAGDVARPAGDVARPAGDVARPPAEVAQPHARRVLPRPGSRIARERDWATAAWLAIPHGDLSRLSGEES